MLRRVKCPAALHAGLSLLLLLSLLPVLLLVIPLLVLCSYCVLHGRDSSVGRASDRDNSVSRASARDSSIGRASDRDNSVGTITPTDTDEVIHYLQFVITVLITLLLHYLANPCRW